MNAVAVETVVLMTAEQARACIDRIKANLEDVRAELFDLREREGWKALGYTTWEACITTEFHMSRSYAHRLLNAHMVDRILATGGEDVAIGNVGQIPESHARELAVVVDQPEIVRSVVGKVREEKGDAATAADVRNEVDRHLQRPARTTRQPKTRPSVSSGATVDDCRDDAPSYADQSQETYGDAPNAEHWCQECGGTYRGERCPCAALALTDRGGSEGSGATDPVEPADEAGSNATSEPAATVTPSDWPGTASPSGDVPPVAVAAPDAGPTASVQPVAPATRTNSSTSISAGAGKRGSAPSARMFSAPTLDAGDIARTLLDMPGWLDQLVENADAGQKQAIRQAFGVTTEAAPATGPRKPSEIVAEIKALPIGLQRSAISSVLSILADDLPADDQRLFLPRLETLLTTIREGKGAVGIRALAGGR